ncbi:hypothetical protein H4582DRAFT_2073916 [Lactarius indigo]|nr:hypothetical protein H4582DRAFT_2073916 [Lactarius indigo]
MTPRSQLIINWAPPSEPVPCSETEPISKISPRQTQRQLLPPQHRTNSLTTAHHRNKFIFDPPALSTCHSLALCWFSTSLCHDVLYSQFKALKNAISRPSPLSDGGGDQVFPPSTCDAAAPYLAPPLGIFMATQ